MLRLPLDEIAARVERAQAPILERLDAIALLERIARALEEFPSITLDATQKPSDTVDRKRG